MEQSKEMEGSNLWVGTSPLSSRFSNTPGAPPGEPIKGFMGGSETADEYHHHHAGQSLFPDPNPSTFGVKTLIAPPTQGAAVRVVRIHLTFGMCMRIVTTPETEPIKVSLTLW